MLAINNIKIKYSQEGYLPNYPPHLISDEEMCEAFLSNRDTESKELDSSTYVYFDDMYPLYNEDLESEYNLLINALRFHIVRFLTKVESFYSDLPDWVYSYMLGQVINDSSDKADIHYFLVGIHRDNMDDVLTPESQEACYKISKRYVNKLDREYKYLDLFELLNEVDKQSKKPIYSDADKEIIYSELDKWKVAVPDSGQIMIRPPSMFGEQNIIKLIRLSAV